MIVKEMVGRLEATEEWKSWREKNPGHYLVHLLFMSGQNPQVGYYSGEDDSMFSFEISDSGVRAAPAGEIFKESGTIEPLDLDRVSVDEDAAERTAMDAYRKNYRTEEILKKIIVLQNLRAQLYNITLITKSFQTVNIRIDPETGMLISHDTSSLISQLSEI